jgi:polyhydroxyalkanoate synthase
MADLGADRVQVVGWCLGGIMSLLSVADGMVPAASVSMIASPFDFAKVRVMAPIRRLAGLTRGAAGTALYRMMGGAPAPLVSAGFRLSSIDKTLTKPFTVATHLHDRDFLAQIEAVDSFMGDMIAYPGRTFGQLYHRFFRVNDLHDGEIELSRGRCIKLADVDVPVLTVAGESDVLAPAAAVHHVGSLLTGSPDVRCETAPGGHLGVLTGRSAERTSWRALDAFLHDNGDAPDGAPGEASASAALPAAG